MIFGVKYDILFDLNMISICLRLFMAVIFGGLIGIERGKKRRAAGFRTHMLVCIGATLVMITNQFICDNFGVSDPARLGAQVISGIGFLGVGTIIVTGKNQVKGLTTAAGLWACACMGLAIGIGFYDGAIAGVLFIFGTITLLHKMDNVLYRRSKVMDIYAELHDASYIKSFIAGTKANNIKISNMEITKSNIAGSNSLGIIMTLYSQDKKEHSDIITELGAIDGIQYIEELK